MLANPTVVRKRIEYIPEREIRVYFKSIYAFCMRAGEGLTLVYPSDKTAHPTGESLRHEVVTYKPRLNSSEAQVLMINQLMETGRAPTLEEIAKIREDALVLEIELEKRKMTVKRRTAIPLNPEYEPFAKEILEYFNEKEAQGEDFFPYYRQKAWQWARKYFKGLEYIIEPYMKAVKVAGKPVYENRHGREKLKMEPVDQKYHRFAVHGCRHMRAMELSENYDIRGKDLDTFVGWVSGRRENGGRMQDRYAGQSWRTYFPKLLKKPEI